MGSSVGARVVTGKYICATTTDMSIELPFTPSYIRLVNLTTFYSVEWFKGMAEPSGLETIGGSMSLETTTMITTYLKFNMDDSSPTIRGFVMGQKANINDTADEIIQYIAVE